MRQIKLPRAGQSGLCQLDIASPRPRSIVPPTSLFFGAMAQGIRYGTIEANPSQGANMTPGSIQHCHILNLSVL